MDNIGGVFFNKGKLTKPLKSFVNRHSIFEYYTQLLPLDAPSVSEKKLVTIPGASPAENIWCCRKT